MEQLEEEASEVKLPTWQDLNLHHWICLARKYGAHRPCALKRSARDLAEEKRAAWMRHQLRLDENGRREIVDRWGNVIRVNERIVTKTLPKVDRTPYVSWLHFALTHAIEVWRKPVPSGEQRRYYMAAITGPEKDGVLAIVGEDDVAFNVFNFDPPYAEQLRNGDLIHQAYTDEARYCTAHRCCEDVVSLERDLDKALRERAELYDRLRGRGTGGKNRNNPSR